MPTDLDDPLTALYVLADDLLPKRDPSRPGPKPRIADAEVICLAVAQVLLDCAKERRFLRFAKRRLGHLFPYVPGQSGYNKRVRDLRPSDRPVSRPSGADLAVVVRRPATDRRHPGPLRAIAPDRGALGVRRARRLRLLRRPLAPLLGLPALPDLRRDGMPIGCELAAANVPEREVVAELLERAELDGHTVIGDKGLSGAEIEDLVAALGGAFLRPDRRDEPPRFGNLGGVRQWIEAIFDQLKDQLSLERHGAHTLPGLCARVAQRLLALAAAIWHNWESAIPGGA